MCGDVEWRCPCPDFFLCLCAPVVVVWRTEKRVRKTFVPGLWVECCFGDKPKLAPPKEAKEANSNEKFSISSLGTRYVYASVQLPLNPKV